MLGFGPISSTPVSGDVVPTPAVFYLAQRVLYPPEAAASDFYFWMAKPGPLPSRLTSYLPISRVFQEIREESDYYWRFRQQSMASLLRAAYLPRRDVLPQILEDVPPFWLDRRSSMAAFLRAIYLPRRDVLPQIEEGRNYQWYLTYAKSIYSLLSLYSSSREGYSRVQNNIAGYNIFVGAGSLPDLTQPPTLFSAALPASVSLTPPGSGEETFYVVVRKQDVYGLNSQNQRPYPITINSSGALQLPALSNPQSLSAQLMPQQSLRVLALYPGAAFDSSPANIWQLWVKTTPPNPATDPVNFSFPVKGRVFAVHTSPESTGINYLALRLYRTIDGAVSSVLTTSIDITANPDEIMPVDSGYQE